LASIVSASGEIQPKTYVNIGQTLSEKYQAVREGRRPGKKGQLLAQLETSVVGRCERGLGRLCKRRGQTGAAEAALNTALAT